MLEPSPDRTARSRTTCARAFASLFFSLLIGVAGPSSAQTAPVPAAEARNVADGVQHFRVERGYKSEDPATGPWLINVLRVDPTKAELRIVHALDAGVGLETVSSMAARHGAVAAVNAGFFKTTGTYRGDPSGVLVLNGKLLSEPANNRSALGLVERGGRTEIFFTRLSFAGQLISGGRASLSVSGINRERGANEVVIYTPEFHRTTLTTSDGLELIVRRSRIVKRLNGRGSSRIPEDGYVISASGRMREPALKALRVGSRVDLSFSLIEESADSRALPLQGDLVGGGPGLIVRGRTAIDPQREGIDPRFVSDRHPRTAVGKLSDGRVLLATVDGRQPGVSAGMSLPELASLLLEFGAVEAINLDGGGSTTMVISGRLMNKPSDASGERPVSDSILVLPRALKKP